MSNKPLTQERLKTLIDYSPESGEFTWHKGLRHRGSGKRAGCRREEGGYRILSVDSRTYSEHRLAWFYVHGAWPDNDVDHINGIKSDNRIENLRQCTRAENMQNQVGNRSKSGLTGAYECNGRFFSHIYKDGKKFYLGCFASPQEANAAYISAKAKHHKFQPQLRPA